MRLARNTLLVNMRFMDMALAKLESVDTMDYPLATDGVRLFYSPVMILREYRTEQNRPARNYMHSVLHCVFRHPFVNSLIDKDLWNLACDIAIENVINDLGVPSLFCQREQMQTAKIDRLKENIKPLTAEKIYRHFLDHRPSVSELIHLQEIFRADAHDLWYLSSGAHSTEAIDSDARQETSLADKAASEKEWKDISERMQQEIEQFVKFRGDESGGLVENLRAVNREKYDYTSFLKRFATMHEAMKINDEEFDYIFYTYGLKLYKKMPLIEPLEYKDIKQIKELVIAIDTSGSVNGEAVQSFLQKTYNILKNEESFFSRFTIYIIQCDATIKEVAKVTTQNEFDRYIETMELHGFGGTDFRPVFTYVDELIQQGEFTNLKGLLYFTDGYGVFPKNKPPYETAFIFVRDQYDVPEVPSWAIKLVLEKEDL